MKAQIFNRACWLYCSSSFDLDIISIILQKSGFQIVGTVENKFLPEGYTKIWLLAESHCAIHTFPEENAIYLELSSCSEIYELAFWKNLQKWLEKNKEIKITLIAPNKYRFNNG